MHLGMTGRFAVGEGRWWTVLTAVFLHGSLLHLAFNMAIGRRYLLEQWWVPAIPGLAIFLVSLAFNLLGDGLRDVLDPRLKF